jgi:hypothetical protein
VFVVSTLPTVHTAPNAVRLAGALVALQGLTGLAFAIAVLVRALGAKTGADNLYGEVGMFVVLAGAILAVAGGLVLGRTWARTPAVVVQLLFIAVAWYAIGPTKLVVPAIITVVVCVAVLALLFIAPSRAWAVREPDES